MRAEWIVYWPCLSKVKPSTDPIATNYDSGELEKRASRIRIQDEFIGLFSSTCDSIRKMKLPNLFKSFQIIQMNLPIPNPKRLGALKPCRCCQRSEWLDLNQNWKWASNYSHHANKCVLIYDANYSCIIYQMGIIIVEWWVVCYQIMMMILIKEILIQIMMYVLLRNKVLNHWWQQLDRIRINSWYYGK